MNCGRRCCRGDTRRAASGRILSCGILFSATFSIVSTLIINCATVRIVAGDILRGCNEGVYTWTRGRITERKRALKSGAAESGSSRKTSSLDALIANSAGIWIGITGISTEASDLTNSNSASRNLARIRRLGAIQSFSYAHTVSASITDGATISIGARSVRNWLQRAQSSWRFAKWSSTIAGVGVNGTDSGLIVAGTVDASGIAKVVNTSAKCGVGEVYRRADSYFGIASNIRTLVGWVTFIISNATSISVATITTGTSIRIIAGTESILAINAAWIRISRAIVTLFSGFNARVSANAFSSVTWSAST